MSLRKADALALEYFVRIWRKGAELLGGVLILDQSGSRTVLSGSYEQMAVAHPLLAELQQIDE
jgi:hypothetical protein